METAEPFKGFDKAKTQTGLESQVQGAMDARKYKPMRSGDPAYKRAYIRTAEKSLYPQCAVCGAIAVVRQSSADGGYFFGCSTFPSCSGTFSFGEYQCRIKAAALEYANRNGIPPTTAVEMLWDFMEKRHPCARTVGGYIEYLKRPITNSTVFSKEQAIVAERFFARSDFDILERTYTRNDGRETVFDDAGGDELIDTLVPEGGDERA